MIFDKGLFCLSLHKNLCCGCSLESPRPGSSNEHPQHRFLWRTDKNYLLIIIKYNQTPYLFICCGTAEPALCIANSEYGVRQTFTVLVLEVLGFLHLTCLPKKAKNIF